MVHRLRHLNKPVFFYCINGEQIFCDGIWYLICDHFHFLTAEAKVPVLGMRN